MFYELFEESKHALFNVVSKDDTAIHLRNTTLIEKYNYSKSQLESLPVDCTPFNGGECSIDSKFTFFFVINFVYQPSTYEFLATHLNISVHLRSNWTLEVLVSEERVKAEYSDKNL